MRNILLTLAIFIFSISSYASMNINQGLVGYWNFDEDQGNIAYDSSVSGNHGTILGATHTSGISKSALNFDGNDYVKCSANPLPTAERTVSLWFYTTNLGTRPVFLAYGGGNCGTSWFMANYGGSYFWMASHCGVNTITYSSPSPVGSWYHFVLTTNSSGTKMYINGIQATSNGTFVNNTDVTNKDLSLGVCINGGGIAPYTDSNVGYFIGLLDEVRIYNRALSDEEIEFLYQHPGGFDGLYILNHNPSGYATHAVNQVDIEFSKAINPASFTLSDVVIEGPGGPIEPNSIENRGDNVWRIKFLEQTELGQYNIFIGPHIEDSNGIEMDQNWNGIKGEYPADNYDSSFTITDAIYFTNNTTIGEGDTTYDSESIIVDGCTLIINGLHTFKNLHILSGGILTHATGIDTFALTVTGDLTIDTGGKIDVTAKGYAPRTGPGYAGDSYSLSGAGYGGRGGNGSSGHIGGGTYGLLTEPQDLGSGSYSWSGGGKIELTVQGILTVNGSIKADGQDVPAGNAYGGGSGGSIYIVSDTLAGSGLISSDGGQAYYDGYGGGGGGRIAVYYQTKDAFTGEITAYGGITGGPSSQTGGAGTIYTKSSSQTHGTLMVGNQDHAGQGTQLLPGTYTFDGIELNNNGLLYIPVGANVVIMPNILSLQDNGQVLVEGGFYSGSVGNGFVSTVIEAGGHLTLKGDCQFSSDLVQIASQGILTLNGNAHLATQSVEIQSGGTFALNKSEIIPTIHIFDGGILTHATGIDTFALTVTGDLTIDTGGKIDVTAKGYAPRTGPGYAGDSYSLSGAGYGGRGGNGSSGHIGGGTYGSLTEPQDLGSGSYSWSGGGKIELTVQGILTVNGSIKADGQDVPAGNAYGGGSGGSIYIVSDTLAGSGLISSDGGQAYYDGYGGGGGGRIAVYYQTKDAFTGEITAYGGITGGPSSQTGGAGTIYTKSSSQTHGTLMVGNQDHAGQGTQLLPGTYTFDGIELNNNGLLYIPVGANVVIMPNILSLQDNGQVLVEGGFYSGSVGNGFVSTVIEAGGHLTLKGDCQFSSDLVQIASQGILTLNGNAHLATQSVEIQSGGTFALNKSEIIPTIHIFDGGILTHATGIDTFALTVTGDLTIDTGGKIDVTAKGYAPRTGPGYAGDSYSLSGAGYGGRGGNGSSGHIGGGTYGSLTEPQDLGSGSYSWSGGGKIELTVQGILTVNGSIKADGQDVPAGNAYGGGSGGSIYIVSDTLAGSGLISSDGGQAYYDGYGGGGGGRIAVYYQTKDAFTGEITAYGGITGGPSSQTGGAGTIYTKSSSQTHGTLMVGNQDHAGQGTQLLPGTYTFDGIELNNNGLLYIPVGANVVIMPNILSLQDNGQVLVEGGFYSGSVGNGFVSTVIEAGGHLTLKGDCQFSSDLVQIASQGILTLNGNAHLATQSVEIQSGGTFALNKSEIIPTIHIFDGGILTHATGIDTFALTVTGDLTIDTGGKIDVTAKGYAPRTGPGYAGDSYSLSGAGYGGRGGNGSSGHIGGGTYGSLTEPQDLGSGSYSWSGGGKIELTVQGILTVNGSIKADGQDVPAGNAYGGGSGGSIYIVSDTLAGSGLISSDGGQAYYDGYGGGGGGRIAVYYQTKDAFTGEITAYGGITGGPSSQTGGAGTIILFGPESAPMITSSTPEGLVDYSVESINIEFVGIIELNTLISQNISLIGPNGNIPINDIVLLEEKFLRQSYQLKFSDQDMDGLYHLKIGPYIQSINSRYLDQDRDDVEAETIDDAYISEFTIDLRGPKVSKSQVVADVDGSGKYIYVWFSEEIQPATLTNNDINIDGGAIVPVEITLVAPRNYRIKFDSATDTHQVWIGPNILDVANHPMDQNDNGVAGENPGDIYDASFTADDVIYSNLLTVDPYGISGFTSIQNAINYATHGDIITVKPGVYKELINFNGKNLTLQSSNLLFDSEDIIKFSSCWLTDSSAGNYIPGFDFDSDYQINFKDFVFLAENWKKQGKTVIQSPGGGSIVTFGNGEKGTAVLQGFTITGGVNGIYIAGNSTPAILDCTINNNTDDGIDIASGGGIIENCLIKHNINGIRSGCAYADIRKCRIESNGTGIQVDDCGTNYVSSIKNCVIAKNTNYGIWSASGVDEVNIANCTIVANGIAGIVELESVKNCIIWDNGDDLVKSSAIYSCISDGDADAGNTAANPYFEDPDNGNYHLRDYSPCIDAGDPSGDFFNEPNSVGNRGIDMGAYGNTDEATMMSNDSDLDGLPDSWELLYWPTDTELSQGAMDDPDFDAYYNITEYELGWNPALINQRVVNLRTGYSYSDIQIAVIFAKVGDVLIAYPGTYLGNINFNGKDILLESYEPEDPEVIAKTIIDCYGLNGFTFSSGETRDAAIYGLTIKNAGKAIYCNNTSPTILNCVIKNSQSYGVHCESSSNPLIDSCTFDNNYRGIYCYASSSCDVRDTMIENISYQYGIYSNSSNLALSNVTVTKTASTGICTEYSTVSLMDCDIHNNSNGGIYLYNSSTGTISRSAMKNNTGHGLYCDNYSSPVVNNCIVARNTSYGVQCVNNANPDIVNCTVADNATYGITNTNGDIINCIIWGNGDDLYNCSATYSCIEDGDSGIGNFAYNPYFVYESTGDYHLLDYSPCLDAGNPSSYYSNEPSNPGNTRIDMGAYGNTDEATIKSPDSDFDGLPDSWERKFWIDLSRYDREDTEGDGLYNIVEYQLGYNPKVVDIFNGYIFNQTANLVYSSIDRAVACSSDGDEIIVYPGNYQESINFSGKLIRLASTDPEEKNVVAATTIDGVANQVFLFNTHENPNAVLDGLTITGATVGVYCTLTSSPSVKNCMILNNTNEGLYCDNSSPVIDKCSFSNNLRGISAYYSATPTIANSKMYNNRDFGIYCYSYSSAIINTTEIFDNSSFGIYCNYSSPVIKNNLIYNNKSYGIYCSASSPAVENCTIADNTSRGISDSTGTIINCIIWNNGDDLYNCNATFSCIEDEDAGLGNIHYDPSFIDAVKRDYHLLASSLCIDAGAPWSSYAFEPNPNGGRVDMGAYGNTPEAAITIDTDGDGLLDAWELHWWNDPNLPYGPDDNPDSDDFKVGAEYLYNYDPTTTTTESIQIPYINVSPSIIDPLKGQTTIVSFAVNMDCNLDLKITDPANGNAAVFQVLNVLDAGVYNFVWDGKNTGLEVVPSGFYDLYINATKNANTITYTTQGGVNTYPATNSGTSIADTTNFDPYKNIPVKIDFDMSDWGTLLIRVDCSGAQPYYVLNQKLLAPGHHTVYWYGRDGSGQIHDGPFSFYFDYPRAIHKGPIFVDYTVPEIQNLLCNQYRIIPAYGEVTTISYELTEDAHVTINIKDPDGNHFRTLIAADAQTRGAWEVIWDGKDDNGKYVSIEGIYSVEVLAEHPTQPTAYSTITGAITVYR